MIKAVIADDTDIETGAQALLEQTKTSGWWDWPLTAGKRGSCAGNTDRMWCFMDMRMPEYDGSYGITRIKEDYRI